MGRWRYETIEEPSPYGALDTYHKAAAFLSDCAAVEDWGCGTAYFGKVLKGPKYIAIDESPSRFSHKTADLSTYRSTVEGILMRHVLEHNYNWAQILRNAAQSFTRKFALIMFVPFGDVTQKIADYGCGIPDIQFKKSDLLDILRPESSSIHEEVLHPATTQYQHETIFYITK